MARDNSCPRRSEYLKNGCKECKRRKIKCDEFLNPPPDACLTINHQGRELCWQCTRLKKLCEYPSKGERVPRVSKRVLLERSRKVHEVALLRENRSPMLSRRHSIDPAPFPSAPKPISGPVSGSISGPGPVQSYLIYPERPILQMLSEAPPPQFPRSTCHIHDTAHYRNPEQPRNGPPMFPSTGHINDPNMHRLIQDSALVSPQTSNSSSANDSSVSELNGSRSYDSADLTLIATDLNNLVSDMIFEVDNDLKTSTDVQMKVAGALDAGPSPHAPDRAHTMSYGHIPRNVGTGIFDVTQEERVYLQEFYLSFASVILPFNAYDTSQQSYYNPMRDLLFYCAYNESFMLAAILAQGARSIFLKSNCADHEFAYRKYLLKCLELLGPALGDHMAIVEQAQLPNIETVLLTVLLLTSSNTANSKQNWRPHLQGAKDILLKHPTGRKGPLGSKLLLLCKYWFMSFEILAGLGLKYGGTVESNEELDVLFSILGRNEVQVLSTLGLVSQNGFFLIGGFHIELIPAWKDLIKLLSRKRRDPGCVADETTEYLRLLAVFERHTRTEFVNRKALLRNTDFPGGYVPAGILLDIITVNHEPVIVSWMDASQQLYCLAATITILTEFFQLTHDSPQVQALVHRMASFLDFLLDCTEAPPLIKCAVMMIQWPMSVVGINLVREKDQHLVLKFFDMAMAAGAGSAGYVIARMEGIWKNRETGGTEPIDDDVDVVYY